MAKNGKIFDENGNLIYPLTVSTEVKDPTSGQTVKAQINEINNKIVDEIGSKIIQSGTFEEAYAKSQINNVVFPWLLVDTVDGDSIIKPIWHVGNSVFVDAAGATISIETSAPSVPTITIDGNSATSGSTVAKNTEVVITPSSGTTLYYKTSNDASYTASASAVTLTLGTTGSITIQAYCHNSAGNSSVVSVTLTVEGTAVPVFSAASGEVSRGATITITASGTLYYSTDGGTTWTNGGTSASVRITGNITIQAYNVVDGEQSDTISRTYTMAALAAPTFSIASGTELDAGGQDVAISASGSSIKYTTDGTDPSSSGTATTVSGTSATINVAEDMTIRVIAVDAYGTSAEASATYTIAVDRKFQFKIALTADNSTEYIPVTASGAPKYTMTVDWGDGSDVESYTSQRFSNKGLSHAYSGSAGDEFTITLRGSAIPVLYFSLATTNNVAALVEIVDNTLECDTFLTVNNSNLRSICANAFQNNTNNGSDNTLPLIRFNCSSLTSIPDGLLSHLTKSGVALTSCSQMFESSYLALTSSQLNELKSVIGSVTNFSSMFYGFKGTAAIPDDFFDGVADGTVTTVWGLTHTAGSGLTGDAYALYSTLINKVTDSPSTSYAFTASSLSNRNQVPTSWGGTAS